MSLCPGHRFRNLICVCTIQNMLVRVFCQTFGAVPKFANLVDLEHGNFRNFHQRRFELDTLLLKCFFDICSFFSLIRGSHDERTIVSSLRPRKGGYPGKSAFVRDPPTNPEQLVILVCASVCVCAASVGFTRIRYLDSRSTIRALATKAHYCVEKNNFDKIKRRESRRSR